MWFGPTNCAAEGNDRPKLHFYFLLHFSSCLLYLANSMMRKSKIKYETVLSDETPRSESNQWPGKSWAQVWTASWRWHNQTEAERKCRGWCSTKGKGDVNAAPYVQPGHGMNQEVEHVSFAGGGVSQRTWTGIGYSQTGNYSVLCRKGRNKWSGLSPEARCNPGS